MSAVRWLGRVEWLGDAPGANCQATCEAKSGGKWTAAELAKCLADCQGAKPDPAARTACEIGCLDKHPDDPAALAACRATCAVASGGRAAKSPPPKEGFPWGPVAVVGLGVVGVVLWATRGAR